MIHFFLNIEKFYEAEFENGHEIQAIAVIEYPIIHVIAKTLETMEEEYDELDKFIIHSAYDYGEFSIVQFSELTGLGEGVFRYRAKELAKQNYISFENDRVKAIAKGIDFLNIPLFERKIEKTRSFLIDGITHLPLRSYFYKDGKDHLISGDERDSWGNKLFNPAIIHNPPTLELTKLILNIPLEDRTLYSIPTHLKEIKDYDFILMTYPLPIVLSKTPKGIVRKKLFDGFTRIGNAEDINIWQKNLENEIIKTEVIIEERNTERDGVKSNKIHFKSNWGNTRLGSEGRIFNVTPDKLKYFIQKLFGLLSIDENNIFKNDNEIIVGIDKTIFESEGADKKKILEACVRGRDYFRQYEGTGIWLVYLKVIIVDNFIQELVDLYVLLQKETSIIDLLSNYPKNYKILRQNLISINRLDKLEDLDIYLFLHIREKNSIQNYLTLQSE